MKDLFQLSLPESGRRFFDRLVERPDYWSLVTFAENKNLPVYNWFSYKEGFSRDIVLNILDELSIPKGTLVLDPFCGTGTTLLACKQAGYNTIGFDALPLGVFVSSTKLQGEYDMEKLYDAIRSITALKFGETSLKWVDVRFIDIKRAFSRYARNDLLFFKEKVLGIEDEKIRNFMMLALVSIVTKASNTKKDGGVVKITNKRHLPPVRYLLKKKLHRMYKDLENQKESADSTKTRAEARLGDARSLDLEDGCVGACITSPPYLNFVDYTKLYALELSLLLESSDEYLGLSRKTLRSHLGGDNTRESKLNFEDIHLILERLRENTPSFRDIPCMVESYFEDMYLVLKEIYRVSKENAPAALVVGNACFPGVTVDVDLILAELGEDVGFRLQEIRVANVRWCDVHGIVKERPVRESVIVFRK